MDESTKSKLRKLLSDAVEALNAIEEMFDSGSGSRAEGALEAFNAEIDYAQVKREFDEVVDLTIDAGDEEIIERVPVAPSARVVEYEDPDLEVHGDESGGVTDLDLLGRMGVKAVYGGEA